SSAPITVSAVKPWRNALQRERCLPSSVIGPVLLDAFGRLASICLTEVMGTDSLIKMASIGQCELCGNLKLESERTHHFQHSCKFRVSLGRKRLVKTLPTKARRLGDLC